MSLRKRGNPADGPQWVAVYITHNSPEAHILIGKLRAHDIPAMIHQEAGATALGITLGNLGEIKVLVSPDDYDEAAALLFPDSAEQIEACNDKIQLIWQDDGDGAPYYIDDDEE